MKNNFKQVKRKTQNFTVVDNAILMDKNLSLKAKGLLITLLSLPPGWHFTEKGLSAATGEGLKSVRSGLKELEENKYLFRYQTMGEGGKFGEMNYIVFEEPTEVTANDENVKIVTKVNNDLKVEDAICDEPSFQKVNDVEPLCQKGTTEPTVMPKRDNAKRDNAKRDNPFGTQLNNIYNKELKEIKKTVNINNSSSRFVVGESINFYETLSKDELDYVNNWMNYLD